MNQQHECRSKYLSSHSGRTTAHFDSVFLYFYVFLFIIYFNLYGNEVFNVNSIHWIHRINRVNEHRLWNSYRFDHSIGYRIWEKITNTLLLYGFAYTPYCFIQYKMIVFHRLVCIGELVNIYSIIRYTLCYYTIFPLPFGNLATFNLRIEPLNTRNLHFMFILLNGNGLYRFLCHLQKRRTIFIISMSQSASTTI